MPIRTPHSGWWCLFLLIPPSNLWSIKDLLPDDPDTISIHDRHNAARRNFRLAHNSARNKYNRNRKPPPFQVRDHVWLRHFPISKAKLSPRYKGPYILVEFTTPVSVKLIHTAAGTTTRAHVSQLKLAWARILGPWLCLFYRIEIYSVNMYTTYMLIYIYPLCMRKVGCFFFFMYYIEILFININVLSSTRVQFVNIYRYYIEILFINLNVLSSTRAQFVNIYRNAFWSHRAVDSARWGFRCFASGLFIRRPYVTFLLF
jgi:hypothetical protein